MTGDTYQLLALRYATRNARRADHFLGEVAEPDGAMPMDYFIWVAANDERAILIDTGFKPEVGTRRGRIALRSPADALSMAGIDPASIEDIIVTHLHYDHAGTLDGFPGARLHLQAQELDFVTSIRSEGARGAFEVDDITEVIRAVYAGRVHLYDGSVAPWPGISAHLLGGHTPGTQAVRVHTQRGWVVLASDSSHFYENMETGQPFSVTHDVAASLAGYATLHALADSPEHIIPGHDPEVVRRYPPLAPELAGIAVRLDVPPRAAP